MKNSLNSKPVRILAVTLVLTLAMMIFAIPTVMAAGESIYIAQTAQGAGDGSSAENAYGVAWFNDANNWGTGENQIGPGDTVFLCGTLTTDLTFQGSGTESSCITVDGADATLSATITVQERSWWRVQNCTWTDGYANRLISVLGGSNGVFSGNTADDFSGDPAVWLAQGSSTNPADITVSDNYIRTTSADLGNTQHDIIKTEGSSDIIIEGNYLEMRAGGAGNWAHDDCIQTYESGSSASHGNPENWTIRYNRLVMNSAATNDRSWMMLENLSGTNNIYGNLFLGLQGAEYANGISSSDNKSGMVFNIYNNTFVAKNDASTNMLNLQGTGTANLRNNILYAGGSQTMKTGTMTVNRDHNLWYGLGSPSSSGYTGEIKGQDPLFMDYDGNDFSPASNSPAVAAGASLGAPYDGLIVRGATWPDPGTDHQPASGNWTMGAYKDSGLTVTPPDSNPPQGHEALPEEVYSSKSFVEGTYSLGTGNAGLVTTEFDIKPLQGNIDCCVGYTGSSVDPTAMGDLCMILAMDPDGTFKVRDYDQYVALTEVPYSANNVYHVKMVADITNSKYSVWITPPGGSETMIAQGLQIQE